jgi:hypothetical protein
VAFQTAKEPEPLDPEELHALMGGILMRVSGMNSTEFVVTSRIYPVGIRLL